MKTAEVFEWIAFGAFLMFDLLLYWALGWKGQPGIDDDGVYRASGPDTPSCTSPGPGGPTA